MTLRMPMKSEPVEVTAASLCRLLGITPNTLSDLAKRGIVVKGEKRGSYLLQPSVTQYCQYLRALGVGTSDGGSYSEPGAQCAIAQ